jgi:putative membrane protein
MPFEVHAISRWRPAALMAGLFSLWVAVASPLASMDRHSLTAHMAQHLILMTVAAPLILLGAPAITSPQGPNRLRAPGGIVTHPVSEQRRG